MHGDKQNPWWGHWLWYHLLNQERCESMSQSREEAMGLPKGIRIRQIFGFWLIKPIDFRKIVAKQTYKLTHEFTTGSLYESAMDSRFTGHTDAALLELDKQMKKFTDSVLQEG